MTIVFVLDFDETLSPSRWLDDNGYLLVRPKGGHLSLVRKLGEVIHRFLDYVTEIGRVEIVTTAYPEWVSFVLACYSTETHEFVTIETHEAVFINDKRIGITSCRHLYDIHLNPKRDTIHKFIRHHEAKVVIGYGDGDDEKEAIREYQSDEIVTIIIDSEIGMDPIKMQERIRTTTKFVKNLVDDCKFHP